MSIPPALRDRRALRKGDAITRPRGDLDGEIREALAELAEAINESLQRSRRVAAGVRRLEELDFQFSLYLEATMLLTRKSEPARREKLSVQTSPGSAPAARKSSGSAARPPRRRSSLKLNEHDMRFLKSLKIALNESQSRARRGTGAPGSRPNKGKK